MGVGVGVERMVLMAHCCLSIRAWRGRGIRRFCMQPISHARESRSGSTSEESVMVASHAVEHRRRLSCEGYV